MTVFEKYREIQFGKAMLGIMEWREWNGNENGSWDGIGYAHSHSRIQTVR